VDLLGLDLDAFLKEAAAEFAAARDEAALEKVHAKYLGRKAGIVGDLLAQLKSVPKEQKQALGSRANQAKAAVEALDKAAEERVRAAAPANRPAYDVTLPGAPLERGSLHPITQVWQELLEVFGKLGFKLASGPEVERPFYNFEALNIPADHPARDASENFFLEQTARREPSGEEPLLLRSQTSTIQVRALTRERPPLRVVGPGRVYRPDTVDATHLFQFHQIEGLCVDEGISFADLKTVLLLFAREMFGEKVDVRLRPSFFPFTEPSAEFDIKCWVCGGPGCATCKRSGWVELGGCGMVDPNVFAAVGIDPERYTGFAFGFGIDRLAMIRYQIKDVRLLVENDVRFLAQFE
jgi:phenylalanyl-tRNA synthetase alpha chain